MIVVVGAGVVGLTCAVRLAEAGHAVRVVAREPPPATNSAVAAAVWFPYLAAPLARVTAWATRTHDALVALAAGEPESGVVVRELVSYARGPVEEPAWSGAVGGFRRLGAGELAPGYADGWMARVPVVESPRHLPWLVERLERAGGSIEVEPRGVASLAAAGAGAELVVHCSGLGARELAGDASVVPVRGQVVLVDNPGLERVVLDEGDPAGPTYVIPRRDDCVLGGTAEPGATSLEPDAATTESILARAARLVPEIATARVRTVRVGLRPARPAVRLELERPREGPPVIHCYGHGGSGFTLAWGCAEDVVSLAEAASA